MSYEVIYWTQAVVRWTHVFAAILWIGQTFLFHHFERNLRGVAGAGDSVLGELWMVHGGGFYRLEKQRFAAPLPARLHWFRWEAATTWLSGALLIGLVYYGGGLLVEPEQPWNRAALAGVATLVVGWLVYDRLVRTPLAARAVPFAAVGLALLAGTHRALGEVMASRAALIHIGALIGTIMAANVWLRILPAQRRMLDAVAAGSEPDPDLAAIGPRRSKHNSYMVVPLVFVMLASHYPTLTYGHAHSTAILTTLIALGWGAAHALLRR